MQLALLHDDRLNLRLSQMAGIALALLILWLLMRLAGLILSGPALPAPVLPELVASNPPISPVQSDWQLFGPAEAVDYGVFESVQPTPLNLTLRGVVAGEAGYAIIMDENGDEGVYRVGDEITGGARVERIELRRVLMLRNGQREALELSGALPGVTNRVASTVSTDAPANPNALPSGIGIASLSSITGPITMDPGVLARQITILPVAGGGFRVRAGRDATLFTQMGFHLNDIVLAINGQPVNNQSDVQALFSDFQVDRPIAITIRRGDRQMVLTPDLNQILGGS